MRRELKLYVHVPFCVKKCAYCDFLSAESTAAERRLYVEGLIREICSCRELAMQYRITTIFFGGGTPSVLSEEEMGEIFGALSDVFVIDRGAEITSEINPGTVTREKLERYKMIGINRLSIGLQSVNDDELKNLGRIHTYKTFLETYRMVREVGFANVNVDLISAVPGQTNVSWRRTLQTILSLEPVPDHISAYSLIIEEGTPFYDLYEDPAADIRALPLPDEDEERLIYNETKSYLTAAGYKRYEISNYAKSGYECRHNLGYWERKEYLGLGLGASSLLDGERFSNTPDMAEYLAAPGQVKERQKLSEQECMEEFMFLGLRKMQGVSKLEWCRQFGCDIEAVYGLEIEELIRKRLLEEREGYIRLTEYGIDVSNYVFAEFIR